MATPIVNMVSKFSTTTSSHSSSPSGNLFDKLVQLERFRDEPRQRWIPVTTLVMLITQLFCSAGGLTLSGLVFGDKFNIVGQCPSQSFVLFAVRRPLTPVFDRGAVTDTSLATVNIDRPVCRSAHSGRKDKLLHYSLAALPASASLLDCHYGEVDLRGMDGSSSCIFCGGRQDDGREAAPAAGPLLLRHCIVSAFSPLSDYIIP